ncbi:MAG: HD domain-containing protein [Clostridia bacterium]
MKNNITIDIPKDAFTLIQRLQSAGYQAYAVGGCVRDALLQKLPNDWDICTSAKPDEMKLVFSDCRVIETGLKHGTLTVFMGDAPYEITTFRMEGEYSDHRHPDHCVFIDSLEEDLSRRDFTINAMAYSPALGLIDPFHGWRDLLSLTIRCVGQPACRFREDPLRILRALRFSAVLGFTIEAETAAIVHAYRHSLALVSVERIAIELKKLLLGANAAAVLSQYADVFCEFIPEIKPCIGFHQHNRCHQQDVWGHTIGAIHASGPNLLVRLALLFHDLGKPEAFTLDALGNGHFYAHAQFSEAIAQTALKRLKLDNDTIQTVAALVRFHDNEIAPNHRCIRKLLSQIGEQHLRLLLKVQQADRRAHAEPFNQSDSTPQLTALLDEVIAQGQCFQLQDLKMNGEDIIALGVPQGKQVGMILHALFEKVLSGELPNDPDTLLAAAKALMKPC